MSVIRTPASQLRHSRSPEKISSKRSLKLEKKNEDIPTTNNSLISNNRHFISSFDKRLTYKSICDDFSLWKPWQRRIMLCGCTERSSRPLLHILSTVVEPLFHRDYQICSHGEYPAHLMKPIIQSADSSSSERSKVSCSGLDIQQVTVDENPSTDGLLCKDSADNVKRDLVDTGSEKVSSRKSRHTSKMVNRDNVDEDLDNLELESKCILHSHVQTKQSKSNTKLCSCSDKIDNKQITSPRSRFPTLQSNICNQHPQKDVLVDFKTSLKSAYSHYISWSNAERGDFVLELLNVCTQEDMAFFAQCIMQRLSERNDINRLPDDLFLKIFSHLNTRALSNCSQVCQKWKPASNHQILWKKHCYSLAKKIDQVGIFQKIGAYSETINWKKVYIELYQALLKLENGKKLQEELFSRNEEERKATQAMQNALDNAVMIAYFLGRTDVATMDADALQQMIIQEANKSEEPESLEILNPQPVSDIEDDVSVDDNMEVYSSGSLHMLVDDLKQVTNRNLESNEVAADVRHELLQAKNKLNMRNGLSEDNYASMPIVGVKSLKRVRKLQGHEEPVICLQFDAKRVMTGSADRCVRIWDVRSGRNFHKLKGHKGGIRCLQFDENFIVTGSWDTTVMIWDVILPFNLIHTISYHKGAVSCLEMTNDILVTGSHDKNICIWRRGTWELLQSTVAHTGPVLCLSIISVETTNDHLITGSLDRTVKLWTLSTLSLIRTFENHDNAVLTVKCCGNLMASGTANGLVIFWNINSGQKEGAIVAHAGPVYSLCFLSDKFITGGGDHLVKQWDLGTCTCIRSLTGHKGAVLCVRASQKRIISSSSDGSTRIWDVVCNLQQAGGFYDDMNKNVIKTQVLVKQDEISA